MKLKTFLASVLLSAVLLPSLQASPLEDEMKSIATNTRNLRVLLVNSSKKSDALTLIGVILKSVEKARGLVPTLAAKVPAAERAKFIEDYQKAIDGLHAQYLKVQAAVAAGTPDVAKVEFGKLNDLKRNGHQHFASDK